jgi:hypothetical protein
VDVASGARHSAAGWNGCSLLFSLGAAIMVEAMQSAVVSSACVRAATAVQGGRRLRGWTSLAPFGRPRFFVVVGGISGVVEEDPEEDDRIGEDGEGVCSRLLQTCRARLTASVRSSQIFTKREKFFPLVIDEGRNMDQKMQLNAPSGRILCLCSILRVQSLEVKIFLI